MRYEYRIRLSLAFLHVSVILISGDLVSVTVAPCVLVAGAGSRNVQAPSFPRSAEPQHQLQLPSRLRGAFVRSSLHLFCALSGGRDSDESLALLPTPVTSCYGNDNDNPCERDLAAPHPTSPPNERPRFRSFPRREKKGSFCIAADAIPISESRDR